MISCEFVSPILLFIRSHNAPLYLFSRYEESFFGSFEESLFQKIPFDEDSPLSTFCLFSRLVKS